MAVDKTVFTCEHPGCPVKDIRYKVSPPKEPTCPRCKRKLVVKGAKAPAPAPPKPAATAPGS